MQRVWLTLINQMWWVSGTALGAVLGSQVQTQLAGLDFALVALFAVLVVEQWRARSSAKPLWVCAAQLPGCLADMASTRPIGSDWYECCRRHLAGLDHAWTIAPTSSSPSSRWAQ